MKAKLLRLTTLPRLGEVQAARSRVVLARTRWARTRLGQSALSLGTQAHAHPLTCVGVAAGAGFAVGWLIARPLRAMHATTLLSSHVWPWALHLLAMARGDGEE